METVKKLVAKLGKFYWSPEPPENYVFIYGGMPAGIGKIAHTDYGAFNLAWATCKGEHRTKKHQSAIVSSFTYHRKTSKIVADGATVGEWACLLSPKEFHRWLETAQLPPQQKLMLLEVTSRILHLEGA